MNLTESPALPPASLPPNRQQDQIEAVEVAFTALLASPTLSKMLDDLKADDARTLAEQRVIAEIQYSARALSWNERRCRKRFAELGP
jgi:hypothetical protein